MQKSVILFVKTLSRHCQEDEISVYAAQASFFLALSAFPFFLLLFALSRKLPLFIRSELFSFLLYLIPKELSPLLFSIFADLYQTAPAALLSVSALTALWSASRGMLGIERGFSRILCSQPETGFFMRRFKSTVYTLMLLILCLFSLLIMVFGSFLQRLLLQLFSLSPSLNPWFSALRIFTSLVFLSISFILLYSFIPQRQLPVGQHISGAVLASVGWFGVSVFCSLYFQLSRQFTRIYGQLASVALLMLWLYFCLWCLFLGAELNHLLRQKTRKQKNVFF